MYFEYGMTHEDFITMNGNNLSSPFLKATRDIIMAGELKDLDIVVTRGEASNVMKYALANFYDIHNLRIYSHRLKTLESEQDCKFIIKYSRENGINSVHARHLTDMEEQAFRIYDEITPNINILTLENCWLKNDETRHSKPGTSGLNCVKQPSEDEEHFLLDLTSFKYLQKLCLSMPLTLCENDRILIKLKVVDGLSKKKKSSLTVRNIDGKHVLQKNKLGLSVLSKYKLVIKIKTISKIDFSVYENINLNE